MACRKGRSSTKNPPSVRTTTNPLPSTTKSSLSSIPNLMDPVTLPRATLGEITGRTEQTRIVTFADPTESCSNYAPSHPPSFHASSTEEPASPSSQPSMRFDSRLDQFSSSSSSPSSHSGGASEPTTQLGNPNYFLSSTCMPRFRCLACSSSHKVLGGQMF